VTIVGHQFITLTINIGVQHGVREAPRRADLSEAVETCLTLTDYSTCSWRIKKGWGPVD